MPFAALTPSTTFTASRRHSSAVHRAEVVQGGALVMNGTGLVQPGEGLLSDFWGIGQKGAHGVVTTPIANDDVSHEVDERPHERTHLDAGDDDNVVGRQALVAIGDLRVDQRSTPLRTGSLHEVVAGSGSMGPMDPRGRLMCEGEGGRCDGAQGACAQLRRFDGIGHNKSFAELDHIAIEASRHQFAG